jgi:hypothetical protein
MKVTTHSERRSDSLNFDKPLSFYKERYGVKLESEKVIRKKIYDIQVSVSKYHKVFDNVVLVESKFVKNGRFIDRKRQLSKIIGSEISAKSWSDLISKINNLYFDFYKKNNVVCKKELYNSFKIKSYQNSSKLENVIYSNDKAKTLDELYQIYFMGKR